MAQNLQRKMQFATTITVPVPEFQIRRRQFSSCDQCRKGKRACNILVASNEPWVISRPCSNCSKTGKNCTTEWLKSRHGAPNGTPENGRTDHSSDHQIQGNVQTEEQIPFSQCDTMSGFGVDHSDHVYSPSLYVYQQNFESNPPPLMNGNSVLLEDIQHNPDNYDSPNSSRSGEGTSQSHATSYSGMGINGNKGQEIVMDNHHLGFLPEETNHYTPAPLAKKQRRTSVPASSQRQTIRRLSGAAPRRPSFHSVRSSNYANPSSASLEYRLASRANKAFVSGNLVKIYHDSMENALSCWLTEKTCPYDVEVRPYLQKSTLTGSPRESEWGSSWSNRIYERVCNLDRACTSLTGRAFSLSENNAIDMTLRKAVMSFATQWAYSSNRSSATFPGHGNFPNGPNNFGPDGAAESNDASFRTEFDRSMQEKLWHEAKNSLQETASITSFRLVFANIIFALTQRPFNVSQSLSELGHKNVGSFYNEQNDAGPEEISDPSANIKPPPKDVQGLLNSVFELEGPPIYLENALRQMFSYRCKLEKLESQKRTFTNNTPEISPSAGSANSPCGPLGIEDRQTFNLLYWLAVMFDTLSAAINKRPLVVSDEDSDILRDQSNPSTSEDLLLDEFEMFSSLGGRNSNPNNLLVTSSKTEIWGEFFFQQNYSHFQEVVPRWPCSHEDAAATLSNAAPIKVVLFRRITQIQTLLSRRSQSEKLESAIADALTVHDYWNTTYGPFFQDCITYHEALPPRIQSWYIVLAGHWHLAGLLLADLIEEIDEMHAGLDALRVNRISQQLVLNLRLRNAFTISDLSRCSCPSPDSSFSQAKEFHSAVNNGALLTEPWTEVLIQSFSKACSVLLDMFPKPYSAIEFDVELFKSRCESCVKALWYLGKKSDIALMASSILSEAVQEAIELQREQKRASERLYGFDLTSGAVFDDTWGSRDLYAGLFDEHTLGVV